VREVFIQCDHCHERVKSNSDRAGYLQPVDVSVTSGHYGALGLPAPPPPASIHGDLCDDCLEAFVEDVKMFFAGPRVVSS
jgi:hypothetical protein